MPSKVRKIDRVISGRDVILGNQINIDLQRLESLLAEIVNLLKNDRTEIKVERDIDSRTSLIIISDDKHEVRFNSEDIDSLSQLPTQSNLWRSEDLYIA